MTIRFDHTIVHSKDKHQAARFYAEVFGLPEPKGWGPFTSVELSEQLTFDFMDTPDAVVVQHYAFHVDEASFDAIVARLEARGAALWADPHMRTPGINHNHGGRGVYFFDADGHGLEIITARYA